MTKIYKQKSTTKLNPSASRGPTKNVKEKSEKKKSDLNGFNTFVKKIHNLFQKQTQ